jgi:hypothetical protein
MRRCVVKVKPLDLSGIGFQMPGVRCQQTPNPETRNLNTDLVAAQGLHWGNSPARVGILPLNIVAVQAEFS